MRILRLTNSSDVAPAVAESLRAPAVAERTVSCLTGESVETVTRVFWPAPTLPDIVAGWLERFTPDVVFIRTSSFWCVYESVPLRIQRRGGPAGRIVARPLLKAGGSPTLAGRRPVRFLRQAAVRTIGGDVYFTPAEATASVTAVLRRILAREAVIPVVRGPGHILNAGGHAAGLRRAERRIHELDGQLAEACRSLHVSYIAVAGTAGPELLQPDGVHENIDGARFFGELEGQAIAEAWLATRFPPAAEGRARPTHTLAASSE